MAGYIQIVLHPNAGSWTRSATMDKGFWRSIGYAAGKCVYKNTQDDGSIVDAIYEISENALPAALAICQVTKFALSFNYSPVLEDFLG